MIISMSYISCHFDLYLDKAVAIWQVTKSAEKMTCVN